MIKNKVLIIKRLMVISIIYFIFKIYNFNFIINLVLVHIININILFN